MKYVLNPKDFKFNDSVNYPELHDFFGRKTFIKATGEHLHSEVGDHAFWYTAITPNTYEDDRFTIYKGLFFKGKQIKKSDWPTEVYSGVISTESFAKDLLCNLLATHKSETVQTHGVERLEMECLYKKEVSLNVKNKGDLWLI